MDEFAYNGIWAAWKGRTSKVIRAQKLGKNCTEDITLIDATDYGSIKAFNIWNDHLVSVAWNDHDIVLRVNHLELHSVLEVSLPTNGLPLTTVHEVNKVLLEVIGDLLCVVVIFTKSGDVAVISMELNSPSPVPQTLSLGKLNSPPLD